MPSNVATLLSGGVSVGILAGVVSGLFYLVVAGFRWAGEVRHQSGEWFQKQLQRRLSRTPAVGDVEHRSNGSIMASESAHVREFIERLVESLVAGGLDHVNVNRLYSHAHYKPLDESDSPSAAHAELKQLVEQIVRAAMTLPALQQGLTNSSTNSNNKIPQDDINSKTYEDILATAILNKVIERFQQYSFVSATSTDCNSLTSTTPTDRNSNILFKTTDMDQEPKFVSRVEISTDNCHTESSCIDETLEDGSWSDSSQTEPLSLKLEECIEEEEEVTLYSSEEEEEEREEGQTSTGAELDFYLSGLNFIKRHRVPFPELGMDIVDGRDEQDEREEGDSPQPTDLLSPMDSWEENWLFQRRRLKVGGAHHHPMPVPMLVPNPSEDYRALIGDQDAEETSDLSDCSDGVYDDLLDIERQINADRYVGTLTEEAVNIAEARNDELANSIDSSSEYGQQDSEYTEDYASVTQRQMNSLTRSHDLDTTSKPTPTPRPRTILLADSSLEDSPDNTTRETSLTDSSLTDLAKPPRPGISQSEKSEQHCMSHAWTGTIAEREHRKWESAVPLENNPYSSENIMKRLNRSSLLDIRSSCQVKAEPGYQPKPETTEQTQSDVLRYGRDYYVNASKCSAGCVARPVEIVMKPSSVDQSRVEVIAVESEMSPHVGSEVTRLQKSINQKEQLWLKTINSNKNEQDPKIDNNLKEETNGHINLCDKSYDVDAQMVVVRRQQKPKLENSTCKNLKNGLLNIDNTTNKEVSVPKQSNSNVILCKNENDKSKSVRLCEKQENVNKSAVTNGKKANDISKSNVALSSAAKRVNNVKVIANEKASVLLTSGGSSASSDSEMTIAMPSVRDLAKQFTGHTDISPSKSPSPVSRTQQATTTKRSPSGTDNSPRREVHSLTARSISRVFREELKRNQSVNTPLPASSDSSHSQRSSSDACYTSDESSTSPTPGPGSLRNNIAFWEQLRK